MWALAAITVATVMRCVVQFVDLCFVCMYDALMTQTTYYIFIHSLQLALLQIFDITPIYGTLRPGESEKVTLTFYGHANIGSEVCAVCDVDGGPSYEIRLKGEASLVSYKFDTLEIDYDKIVSTSSHCIVTAWMHTKLILYFITRRCSCVTLTTELCHCDQYLVVSTYVRFCSRVLNHVFLLSLVAVKTGYKAVLIAQCRKDMFGVQFHRHFFICSLTDSSTQV